MAAATAAVSLTVLTVATTAARLVRGVGLSLGQHSDACTLTKQNVSHTHTQGHMHRTAEQQLHPRDFSAQPACWAVTAEWMQAKRSWHVP
jgi:hypothetical protein